MVCNVERREFNWKAERVDMENLSLHICNTFPRLKNFPSMMKGMTEIGFIKMFREID